MKQVLIITLLVAASCCGYAQKDTNTYKAVTYPAGYTAQLNVVYTAVDGWEGKMDLYLPPAAAGPVPVIINIHGGGWNHGTKESQTGFSTFFKLGFAVANIEYRLTGMATAPAAVEDVRCALIYLIRNAGKLGIDVNKIVVMGSSAGGHLALMAGLLENDHRFDGNCKGVENIKVAAIVDKYGIADVSDWATGVVRSKSATAWLGAKGMAFAPQVSPLTYVKKTSPPVFIVHGDADPVVGYQQSVTLHKKLQDAGVVTRFMTVPGGQHGKFSPGKNREMNKAIVSFLQETGVAKK